MGGKDLFDMYQYNLDYVLLIRTAWQHPSSYSTILQRKVRILYLRKTTVTIRKAFQSFN
jgi:hypothetical protein